MGILAKNHQVWINYLQPEGLIVSSMVLEDSQLALPSDLRERQIHFLSLLDQRDDSSFIRDWGEFTKLFLKWPDRFLKTGDDIPDAHTIYLPEYNETLSPSQVIQKKDGTPLALVQVLSEDIILDKPAQDRSTWIASPQRKLERLLRETGNSIGIITNLREIAIIYAPRGENAGILTFPMGFMTTVMGRPALGALLLLLGQKPLWADVPERQLPELLSKSRSAQAKVSSALAHQVLAALYELLRGFATANSIEKGELLDDIAEDSPQDIYGGLLTVLMRLVFLLYAEDRGLMPGTDIYEKAYSVHGLWAKTREESVQFPDTMDQRYGAWARLLALFRVVYEGCEHPELVLPPRLGHLFDPLRYPFLEGRKDIPAIPDGTIARILDNLLLLNGEKLSYRTLDVEQIGSVYEAVMGFQFQVVSGLSIAIRPAKSHGAPPIVDLEALLAVKAADRNKTFKAWTDRKLNTASSKALKEASSVENVLDALIDLQDSTATPSPVPEGGWVLQPTDERRRSGSHYTPRSLTQPIVERALEPIWVRLGDNPQPEDILDLNVCDPSMGSGAFLVESCRQIADKLLDAWHYHRCLPVIPHDEDEVLHARRVVAQRCLYGVDRNPMAVDLGKLSLWLATLAKDHPFTFLDHALRCGDSLVGLNQQHIKAFHWDVNQPSGFIRSIMEDKLRTATTIRNRILNADEESFTPEKKAEQLSLAEEELNKVRLAGDLIISAWFGSEKNKDRLTQLEEYKNAFQWALDKPEKWADLETHVLSLKQGEYPVVPFHWEIEYPEVFTYENGGFDCFVGNPPFAGKNTVASGNHKQYPKWLQELHPESHGNSDLVAHFFRRAFNLLKPEGSFGLIATNTIGQGDTRSTGLRWICTHGGCIYNAIKRLRWPGQAAVVVSVVHIQKTENLIIPRILDKKNVELITAYLFHQGQHEDPKRLLINTNQSFQGCIILGMGFTFDDTDKKGVTSTISEMNHLIEENSNNAERIFPYIGGAEVNDSPTHLHHRYIINFFDMDEEDAKKWPDLYKIIKVKVKPAREKQKDKVGKEFWWRFLRFRPALYNRIEDFEKVLVAPQTSKYRTFTFLPNGMVYDQKLVVFAIESMAVFCIMQSRLHEEWAVFFGSTMKDDPVYTPSDCYETFPFPENLENNTPLEEAGKNYYDYRAKLMIDSNLGLTKTYNRFHDPDEHSEEILELRRLHDEMDKAVLNAYGWSDLLSDCNFSLEYEEEEVEEESSGRRRKKKKPWRYRWPDEIRDQLLARLLDLNAAQAAAQGDVVFAEESDDDSDDIEEE